MSNQNKNSGGNPADTKTADSSKSAEKCDRDYSPEEIHQIGKHALPIYQELIRGELRGRDLAMVARVAFHRAQAFVGVLKAFSETGVIPAIPQRKLAKVSAPNLDPMKFKLRAEQLAMRDYIQAGEPGPEYLNQRLRELVGDN